MLERRDPGPVAGGERVHRAEEGWAIMRTLQFIKGMQPLPAGTALFNCHDTLIPLGWICHSTHNPLEASHEPAQPVPVIRQQ
jgi:hypothetical protein